MRKPIYILLALTFVSCVNSYVHPCEEELIRLDRTLDNMDEYVTIKESRIAAISETLEDPQLTPVQRSPGEGNGNPLQYYCLENPMDRGAW